MVPGDVDTTFEYASGTWTAGGGLNQPRNRAASGAQASQSQTLIFGGNTAPAAVQNNTELYDGTSWTSKAAMNTARRGLGGAGSSSTSALAFGGFISPGAHSVNDTEQYTAGINSVTITTS
jgi:hypothetical protein